MTESPRVGPAFEDVLRAGRQDFNRRFAEARHEFPDLNGDVFFQFLLRVVDPWVRATESARAEAVPRVAQSGFDIGLQLVGQRLAGPGGRVPALDDGLRRMLIAATRPAAEEPLRALSSFGNAIFQLLEASGDVETWMVAMDSLAETAPDLSTLLGCGQVLAWRCGLAHYRDGALTVAASLPEPMARAALGVDDELDLATLLERLRADPWHLPEQIGPEQLDPAPPRPFVAHRAGGFRGFGGLFADLPRVAEIDGCLVATSGDRAWQVTADAFGCTLHRMGDATLVEGPARPPRLPAGLDLATEGKLRSVARVGSTLLATTDATYDVLVVALPPGESR